MAEPREKILETVIEDLDAKKPAAKARASKQTKVKKRHKMSTEASIVKAHSHKRSITADVSNKMMDKIKEEPDAASEKSAENTKVEEPKVYINKILVRTPAVGTENGRESVESNKAEDCHKETKASENADHAMLARSNTFEREVSFSIRSEVSQVSEKRVNSRRNKRPKSCRKFTKEDLELFLPRKSFFNSHDKLLIEAGQQVDTHKERKKPDWRSILKMHTMDELYPVNKEGTDDDDQDAKEDDTESEDELFSMEKTETLVSKEGHKSRSKSSSKNAGNPEREKYKPLYEYLKYIHDNPEEYVAQTKFTTKNLEHKHPNTLVRMGRIFRRGPHVRNNIYLHAISGLKANAQEQGISQDEVDIVRLKVKAEAWLKGLTTQQYLKAKELALKDVGEEDLNYTKWWLAFKSCQYLRLPQHVVTET